ncbi:MAG: aldo/keto reductase [Anaerolineaceae bacterium]|nr:aldo/keto reductase [Anaerolineaceae bacterium]
MQYRKFGKSDWKVSALGFGVMRMPVIDGDSSKIDEQEGTRMVRYAIDHGVNYVDTAYPYHGGNSELFVGRVLQDGYREKVRLATKMPAWLIEAPEDFDKYLDEQLEKLQTDYVDFYLLHGLNLDRWTKIHELGILDWVDKPKSDGRIRNIGFSFHDTTDTFKKIIDAYDKWDFCQIQYNYMDIERQAGTEGLKYAASKGLAVVIMEPLLGGRLVEPPDPIKELWDSTPTKRSPVDWALQWLWNLPEVSVVLSGMSTLQHVQENVISANSSGIGTITDEEQAIIDRVREKYQELSPINCTRCEYCLPCSEGLDIPQILSMFNSGKMYDKLEMARNMYERFVPEDKRAAFCIACQECEERCPQEIPISEWMVKVDKVLAQGMSYEDVLEV